ncbi:MAG: hypothetical protein KDB08_09925 [Microthrixaceae bacterium]|nr:hypothetical protein [Microthrixaceae bacterium]
MNLFEFLSAYWWLAFPLIGALAGTGRAWQKGLERRHTRRLEVLRVKGELRAAQLAAKEQGAARRSAPAAATAPPAQAGTEPGRLVRLLAAHDDINRRWLEYELDVARIIAFPTMSDGREPLTAAFLRAKKVADGLRPESARVRLDPAALNEYRDAVHDYEVAFEIAEQDARRRRDTGFDPAERKRLETAQQLLSVAVDSAATPAERQLAYRRVRQELDGLIALSDEAIEVLESKVSQELTRGDTPAGGAVSNAESSPVWPIPARDPRPGGPPRDA